MKGSGKIQRDVAADSVPPKDPTGDSSGRQDSGYSSSFIDSLIPDVPPEEPALDTKSKQFDSGVDIEEQHATPTATETAAPTVVTPPHPLSSKETFALWKEIFTPDEDYDTPLHLYIAHGDLEKAFKIIKLAPHPDFLNFSNFNSETPLHFAILYNQPAAVRRLVVCGAATNLQDCSGNTALHLACMLGRLECARNLTFPVTPSEIHQAGPVFPVVPARVSLALLDRRNYEGEAALHLAVSRNHQALVELLVDLRASLNIKDGKAGRTPLHLAVSSLNLGLARLLLKQPGTEVNCPNYGGLSALDELRKSVNDNFDDSFVHCSMRDLLLKYKAHCLQSGLPDSDNSSSEEDEGLFSDFPSDTATNNKPLTQTAAG